MDADRRNGRHGYEYGPKRVHVNGVVDLIAAVAVNHSLSPRDLVWCAEHAPDVFEAVVGFAARVAKEQSKKR